MELEEFVKKFNKRNTYKKMEGLHEYLNRGTRLVYKKEFPLSYIINFNEHNFGESFDEITQIFVKTRNFEKMMHELISNNYADIDYYGGIFYQSNFQKTNNSSDINDYSLSLGLITGSLNIQNNKLLQNISFSNPPYKLTQETFGNNFNQNLAENVVKGYIAGKYQTF